MYMYLCVGGYITIILKEEVMNLRGSGGHGRRRKGRIKNYINIVFIYEYIL